MEVRVTAPAGGFDVVFLTGLIDAFHAAHRRTFGYDYAGQQKIELINLCVSGFGLIERPRLPRLPGRTGDPTAKASRAVYFGNQFRDTPVFDRASLPPASCINGPAVIEEFGSTTLVFPGQSAAVDPYGILVIRSSSSQETPR